MTGIFSSEFLVRIMARVKPKVVLVGATPNPAGVVAAAARLCYAEDTGDLLEGDVARDKKFVNKLFSLGHLSPIEHASFTFFVEGVSRAMTHQLVRHRLASYSQRSQRYVSHASFDYVVPPRIEGRKVVIDGEEVDAVEYFEATMEMLARRYSLLIEALGATGEQSNQDARYVLPNACETKIFITMNARELLHFFAERLCIRAQWEIRDVAGRMLELVKDKFPAVFGGAGPKCIKIGHCPEGKMTCGKFKEMAEKYGEKK